MGLFDDAKKSLHEALRVRRNLGEEDNITATLNALGLLYASISDFDQAAACYSEATDIHSRRADTQDRLLSMTMVEHNLQRNAIQKGDKLPTVDELHATIAKFRPTASWWMIGQ